MSFPEATDCAPNPRVRSASFLRLQPSRDRSTILIHSGARSSSLLKRTRLKLSFALIKKPRDRWGRFRCGSSDLRA